MTDPHSISQWRVAALHLCVAPGGDLDHHDWRLQACVRVSECRMCRAELAADASLDYLGLRPERLAWRLGDGEVPEAFAGGPAQAVFRTQERAIDTDELAAVASRRPRWPRAVLPWMAVNLCCGKLIMQADLSPSERLALLAAVARRIAKDAVMPVLLLPRQIRKVPGRLRRIFSRP